MNTITAIGVLLCSILTIVKCVEVESRTNIIERVICHYNGWAETRRAPRNYVYEDIPIGLCSHVVFDFVGINDETYQLTSLVPLYKEDSDRYNTLSSLKGRQPNLKFLFALGGWDFGGKTLTKMVAQEDRRQKFIKSTLKWLAKHKFDGIDLFWQYPGDYATGGQPNDKHNLVKLVQEMKQAFEADQYILSLSMPIVPHYINVGYDISALTPHVDWITALTYDLRGRWDNKTGVHGTLHPRLTESSVLQDLTVERGINKLLKQINPSKLVMGIGLFGRTFVLADPKQYEVGSPIIQNAGAQLGEYVLSDNIFAYFEILHRLKHNRWAQIFDNEAKAPFAFKDNQWVGFEDPDSVGDKVTFALSKGLGGIMVYSVDLDDFLGEFGDTNPLMGAIAKRLSLNVVLDARQRERIEQRLKLLPKSNQADTFP